MRNEDFFVKVFREFYEKHFIKLPYNSEKREFGIGFFGKKIGKRHMGFSSTDEFNEFLRNSVPMYVSCSDSLYNLPRASPMKEKDMYGGDITYEFDADDIVDSLYWVCSCGAKGKGDIGKCPECGKDVKSKEWYGKKDLEATKKQMFDLIKVVENEFGFKDCEINFSGNAGYHVHLRGEDVRNLSKEARIELVDYLKIENYDLLNMGFCNGKIPLKKGVGKKLFEYLKKMDRKELFDLLGRKFEGELEGDYFPSLGRGGEEKWLKALDYAAHKLRLDIDRQTSVDIYKIIRVPNTLHGGTGMLAEKIKIEDLKDYSPLDNSVVLGNEEVEIEVIGSPKFYLKDREWGPYEKGKIKVPLFLAVYLIGKGVGQIL